MGKRRAWVLTGAMLVTAGVWNAASRPVAAGAPEARKKKTVITLEDLTRRFEGEGVKGLIHGARHAQGAYVFTWYHPEDFFESRQFSLAPANPEVARALTALERHQQVTLRGKLLSNGAAQPHLRVESLSPGAKWDPGVKVAAPSPIPDLTKALKPRGRIPALVHALEETGDVLVIEALGAVIPVRVPADPKLRETVGALYRGDRIELSYRVAERPGIPLHLELQAEGDRPALKVIDRIVAQHEQMRTVEGQLVLFPKSPVLTRALWGVEEKGPDGLHRYFTIFNFQDLNDQGKIQTLLETAWKGTPEGVVDGRNKYIHTGVRVRVTGKVSNQAKNQANPTLVTTSAGVSIIEAPKAL